MSYTNQRKLLDFCCGLLPTDKAAGNSADYTHGVLGVPFCYAIELPDTGDHGFLLPPRYIIPVGQETLEAIKVIGQAGLGYLGNETAKMAPSLTTA